MVVSVYGLFIVQRVFPDWDWLFVNLPCLSTARGAWCLKYVQTADGSWPPSEWQVAGVCSSQRTPTCSSSLEKVAI